MDKTRKEFIKLAFQVFWNNYCNNLHVQLIPLSLCLVLTLIAHPSKDVAEYFPHWLNLSAAFT